MTHRHAGHHESQRGPRLPGGPLDPGALAVAAAVLAARLVHALVTRFLFDDALITARYGRNLAQGLGFAFNAGEPSYGFTSPAWVVLSALGTLLHVDAHLWLTGLGIVFDTATAYFAARLVASLPGRVVLAALLASWPVLVTSSVGGMETSLLGLCAVLWLARVRSGTAATLAPLVRPEGWLLALAHLARERRPAAALVLAPGLGWAAAAWALFGSPLPLAAQAKHVVYTGSLVERAVVWLYHLAQFPVYQVRPPKLALVVSSLSLVLTALAMSRGGRGWPLGLALLCVAFLVVGGAPVFDWYLALPYLLLIVAASRSDILARWRVGAAAIALNAVFLFVWTVQDGAHQRRLLDHTWREAARYAARYPGVRSVFAEAVGVLGWEFPGSVYDEVGIVTPRMGSFRHHTDGWYYRAAAGLRPHALLVRPMLFYRNEPVAGVARPFEDERQFQELGLDYVETADFQDTTRSAGAGVSWVRVLVRRDLAEAAGQSARALPAPGAAGPPPGESP